MACSRHESQLGIEKGYLSVWMDPMLDFGQGGYGDTVGGH